MNYNKQPPPYDNFVRYKYQDRNYNNNSSTEKKKWMSMLEKSWTDFKLSRPDTEFTIKDIIKYDLADERYRGGIRTVKSTVVATRNMTNMLGCEEEVYYYLTVKKFLSRKWASEDQSNIPKYENIPGVPFDLDAIEQINSLIDKNIPVCLVGSNCIREYVYNEINDMKFEFYYIGFKEFKEYFKKYGKRATYQVPETKRWKVTIPTNIMIREDPLNKILVPIAVNK